MPELPILEYLARSSEEKGPKIFRVSEVNRLIRQTLESAWTDLHIQGELSDVSRSAAGHVYFTLNDEADTAQLRGVIFRADAARCIEVLRDGARVELRGGLSLFEARGQFQLIARSAKAIGEGDLAARFEALRRKLEAEGLFDPARKRKLPRCPRTIGVVSSLTGAALQDIIRVAHKRCPVRILIADCRVQGESAPASIIRAIGMMARFTSLDVLIVARGGGSAEDLWAFNDEGVARAIVSFPVPVVSGVGHEVDITIADLVADLRAATPSNAAELAIPEHEALQNELRHYHRNLMRAVEAQIGRLRLMCERQSRQLEDPRRELADVRHRIQMLSARSAQLVTRLLHQQRHILATRREIIAKHSPRSRLQNQRDRLLRQTQMLRDVARRLLMTQRALASSRTGKLGALSPLKVLERGYAIATLIDSQQAVRSVKDVSSGTRLNVRVADGSFDARVEKNPNDG